MRCLYQTLTEPPLHLDAFKIENSDCRTETGPKEGTEGTVVAVRAGQAS